MNKFNKTYIFGISMVSAMGGLLFGYDWVVIGGAKPFYERFFDIASSANLQAWAMSCALIGCVVGAMEEMTGVAKKDILGQSHREASVPFYGEKVPYLLDFLDGPEGEIPSRYLMLERKGRCLSADAFAPAL